MTMFLILLISRHMQTGLNSQTQLSRPYIHMYTCTHQCKLVGIPIQPVDMFLSDAPVLLS